MKRTYEEICEDLKTAIPGKNARKLHKELKEYGEGLRFCDRYPLLAACLLGVALAIGIVTVMVIAMITVLGC